ncbi:MAG: isoprenylcysteine carboxylmethyltransferase family protein [Lutibacter sp.]|nr:isoprenylcysteine carboxylmethyltransferase family protein [Lutibacter sp.]MBP9601022.1 isoprenylcysteine carboxylmethyltransferase family protein [Lutibacter sp.]
MSGKSFILVTIQFSSFIYFGITGNLFSEGFLFLFQLAAIFIGLWAIVVLKIGNFNIQPEVKSTAVFIKKGPYKIIRNPMYLCILLFFGIAVNHSYSTIRLTIFLILTTSLLLKIFSEEKFLKEKFSNSYNVYKQQTYRLIPYVF